MFVFKKADAEKADAAKAETYQTAALTGAAVFLYFAAIRAA